MIMIMMNLERQIAKDNMCCVCMHAIIVTNRFVLIVYSIQFFFFFFID